MNLSFSELRRANVSRALKWHQGATKWSGSDWFTATAGELGEAGNLVKKLNRWRDGIQTNRDPSPCELTEALAVELADTVIYLDLLADHFGINLATAIADKFNLVSRRQGWEIFIGPDGQAVLEGE